MMLTFLGEDEEEDRQRDIVTEHETSDQPQERIAASHLKSAATCNNTAANRMPQR